MNVIVFGEAGSGKDTVADLLVKNYGYTKLKLGKYVRKHIDEMFPDVSQADRRELYVKYAEGLKETMGEDLWNVILYSKIKESDYPFVIADGRNWVDYHFWVDSEKAKAVGIKANKENIDNRIEEREGSPMHKKDRLSVVESSVRSIIDSMSFGKKEGIVISNDGSLKDLNKEVVKIIKEVSKNA